MAKTAANCSSRDPLELREDIGTVVARAWRANKPNSGKWWQAVTCFGDAPAYGSRVISPNELIAQPDVIIAELGATTAEEAIVQLHARLSAATTAVKNAPQFLAALLERARLASVSIGPDVALPHARTEAVERMVFAVGRASRGIAFDEAHPQVRLIFLIGIPRQQITEYLHFVAALSRLLKRDGVRAALLAATNEDELRAPLARAMTMKL